MRRQNSPAVEMTRSLGPEMGVRRFVGGSAVSNVAVAPASSFGPQTHGFCVILDVRVGSWGRMGGCRSRGRPRRRRGGKRGVEADFLKWCDERSKTVYKERRAHGHSRQAVCLPRPKLFHSFLSLLRTANMSAIFRARQDSGELQPPHFLFGWRRENEMPGDGRPERSASARGPRNISSGGDTPLRLPPYTPSCTRDLSQTDVK